MLTKTHAYNVRNEIVAINHDFNVKNYDILAQIIYRP